MGINNQFIQIYLLIIYLSIFIVFFNFICLLPTGDRDIVGYGFNGTASYIDREEYPCPAIRFGANTPEVLALREKEKGDWKTLSVEDQKACKLSLWDRNSNQDNKSLQ